MNGFNPNPALLPRYVGFTILGGYGSGTLLAAGIVLPAGGTPPTVIR